MTVATKRKPKRATAVVVVKPNDDVPRSHRSTGAVGDSDAVNESADADRSKSNGRENGHANGRENETEILIVGKTNETGGGDTTAETDQVRAASCLELQALQRRRAAAIKSRVAIDNQLTALVATELGYHAGMDEATREERWKQAGQIIKSIDAGDDLGPELKAVSRRVAGVVESTRIARKGFDRYVKGLEKEMVAQAGTLPVAPWAESIRGFGLLRLAVVLGETGNLSNYSNPGKVWKRLGMAPFNGKMPSTWRGGKEGKLSAEEWTAIGYSPRRRSIMYVVAELLVKLNFEKRAGENGEIIGDLEGAAADSPAHEIPGTDGEKKVDNGPEHAAVPGPYRARYDEARVTVVNKMDHAGEPWSKGRQHAHAMLLCAKRLARDLWIQWRK